MLAWLIFVETVMQSFRCIINQPNHPSRVAARRSYRSPSVAPVDRKCCKTPPPTIINDPRLLTQSTFICAILRSNIEHGKAVSIASCIAAVDRTSWQLSRQRKGRMMCQTRLYKHDLHHVEDCEI